MAKNGTIPYLCQSNQVSIVNVVTRRRPPSLIVRGAIGSVMGTRTSTARSFNDKLYLGYDRVSPRPQRRHDGSPFSTSPGERQQSVPAEPDTTDTGKRFGNKFTLPGRAPCRRRSTTTTQPRSSSLSSMAIAQV